jgi:hypothetical protein
MGSREQAKALDNRRVPADRERATYVRRSLQWRPSMISAAAPWALVIAGRATPWRSHPTKHLTRFRDIGALVQAVNRS